MTSSSSELKGLRVAIVNNWFYKMRGGERVVKALCEIFPQADLYALFGDSDFVEENFPGHKVFFSWLQKIPGISRIYKSTLAFWPVAIESFKFNDYDLVISTSASVTHGVVTPYSVPHIAYIFTPMRYLWDQKDLYLSRYSWLRRLLVMPVLHYLRMWDVAASKRPDHLIAVSQFVNRRMIKFWGRGATSVIYPPVEISKSSQADKVQRSDYYLALSPFEENKGAEDAIRLAINNGWTLRLTGDGKMKTRLMKKYFKHENIQFLGWVSEGEKQALLNKAKALLFLGEEDFGIAAVEAIGCGCPVIAYDKGAVREISEQLGGVVIIENAESVIELSNVKFGAGGVENFSQKAFADNFIDAVQKARRDLL